MNLQKSSPLQTHTHTMESTPRAPMSWAKRDDREGRESRDPQDDRSNWRSRGKPARGGARGGSRNSRQGFRDGYSSRDSRDGPRDREGSRDDSSYRDDDLFSEGAWNDNRRSDSRNSYSRYSDRPRQWMDSPQGGVPNKPWQQREDRYDRERDRDERRDSTPQYRDRRVSGPPPPLPSTPSRASSTGPGPSGPASAPRPARRPLPDQAVVASQPETASAKRKRKKASAGNTALTDSNIHNPNNPNYIGYTKKEARERERKKQGEEGDVSIDSSVNGSAPVEDSRKRFNSTFNEGPEYKRTKRDSLPESNDTPQFDDEVPTYGDDEPGEVATAAKPKVTQRNLTSSIFDRVTQVGEGTYGKVYKAVNQVSGTTSALKRLRLETEREGFPVTALREIKLLQSLRHDNIISLKEMMVEEKGVFMIFGYMSHDLSGILAQPTVRLTEGHIKFLFRQILSGLTYIHQRGILHRDIKGSNILVDNDGNLKLADFGLSRTIDTSNKRARYSNRVITLWYRPPELLFGATVYDGAVDNWGAGCLLVELYSRLAVFRGSDEINQLDCIFDIMGTPSNEYWPELEKLPWFEMLRFNQSKPSKFVEMYNQVCSEPALQMASKLLEMNPAYRMTSQQALDSDYFEVEPKPERPLVLRELQGEWHEFDAKKLRRARRREDDLKRAKERKERKEAEEKAKAEGLSITDGATGGAVQTETASSAVTASENTTEAAAEPPSAPPTAPDSSREATREPTSAPPSIQPITDGEEVVS